LLPGPHSQSGAYQDQEGRERDPAVRDHDFGFSSGFLARFQLPVMQPSLQSGIHV
jgi:hypothetical protein